MQKEFDTAESLLSKFMGQKDVETGAKEVHQFYGYKIGKIKEQNKIKKYQITDPNSQQLLKDADFYIKNAAACFQEKSLQIFFQKTYSTQKLIHSITNFTKDGSKHISEYITKANYNVKKFKEAYNVDENYAYGCCLALSYYTGSQSQRVSRSCNIVIKLYVKGNVKQLQNSPQYQATRCIGQWLFRALNCISLYWGQVTRCINLAQEEYQLYSPGNIVTWLQFSSSSYSQPTAYFATRNTRFVIYSLSGRCIQTFSNYGATESQVLFKPFSHFLVIKKQLADGKQYIYMRQIFIGQTKKSVLWVDDNIFRADWENKKIMERAIVKQPLLNIIPKVSTQCALAFLESGLGRNRNSSQFRIITDMNRVNQKPSHNAGARFVKACRDLKVNHQILVFTSDKAKAEEHLKQLNVDSNGVKITVDTEDALKYLCFEGWLNYFPKFIPNLKMTFFGKLTLNKD